LPDAIIFVAANVAMAAVALAAGRRIGAVLAYRAVSAQVGSAPLTTVIAWTAGAAGAIAFVAAVPWTTVPEPWPYQALHALLGYVLHVVALAVGPARGVAKYLRAHPFCRSCWVWMQRETGAGAFT